MSIIRKAVDFIMGRDSTFSTKTSAKCDLAVAYFNGLDEIPQIKTAIKKIYATGIRKEKDPAKGKGNIETYVRGAAATQVDEDMIEVVSMGFGQKIINAHATLFTEENGKFSLTTGTEKQNVKPAEDLLEQNRADGGSKVNRVLADKLSIQCGSSAILHSFASNVTYQRFSPGDVRPIFADEIKEDADWRPVDKTNEEHASHIIIRLGSVDVNKWTYLAIFARSKDYKYGRWVTYQAGDTIEVPKFKAKGVNEFSMMPKGETEPIYCNPLSYWASKHPEKKIPEYPISIMYSGMTDSKEMMPTSFRLHEACKGFARDASHVLSKSQEAAASSLVIEHKQTAVGMSLPRSITKMSLAAGQEAKMLPHDSQACLDAYTILKGLMIDVASSFSVPDYMIVSEDHTLDASSGEALKVKTRPLIQSRKFRVDQNSKAVKKSFEIEQAYIEMFSEADESAIEMLSQCSQIWDAGEIKLPENKKEKADRLIKLKKEGFLDEISGLKEYYNFATDAEAIEEYEKMKARAEKYPPLNQPEEPQSPFPEKKKVGLLRGEKR